MNDRLQSFTRTRLLFIGPRHSGTPTGVSNAFELAITTVRNLDPKELVIVDTNLESAIERTGVFRVSKALHVLRCIGKTFVHSWRSDLAYLILSSSRFGFTKDTAVLFCLWLSNCPVVVHLHGGGYLQMYNTFGPVGRFLSRLSLGKVSKIIVLGDGLRSQFGFLDEARIAVVPNGVEDPIIGGDRFEARSKPSDGQPFRFIYLSNLMLSKGFLEVAESTDRLSRQGFSVETHFYGNFLFSSCEKDYEAFREAGARLRELVANSDAVFYHGSVDASERDRSLSSSHCLVLPTNYPGEGQPLSILEAMAVGLPVIATSHAAIPTTICDGKNGFLIRSRRVDDVVDAMRRVLDLDAGEYAAMSSAARSNYLSQFTVAQHTSSLIDVLQNALRATSI